MKGLTAAVISATVHECLPVKLQETDVQQSGLSAGLGETLGS